MNEMYNMSIISCFVFLNLKKVNSISQSELALKIGVNSSLISKLKNTVTNSGEGLSNNKLDELVQRYKLLES